VDGSDPFYAIDISDYVALVVTTGDNEVVLVRQFRPAVERYTIELPSGLVDAGMTPEQAARQELREETGYLTDDLRALGAIQTDVGRLGNRMWCFWARNARPIDDWQPEPGIDVVRCSRADFSRSIDDRTFDHALHLAAVLLATRGPDPLILT
jgi:ADP-ribose pyrophosphatase